MSTNPTQDDGDLATLERPDTQAPPAVPLSPIAALAAKNEAAQAAAGKKAPAPKALEPAVVAAQPGPEPEFEVNVDTAAEAKIEAPDNTADVPESAATPVTNTTAPKTIPVTIDAVATVDTAELQSPPEDAVDAPSDEAQGVNVEPAPAAEAASDPEETTAPEAVADTPADAVSEAEDETADAGADTETPPTDEIAAQTQARPQSAVASRRQADAPESRLRTAMRNPKIVLASAAAAALLLSAVGAYIVVRMHAAPRGHPPAEIHEINAAAATTPQAHAENAAAHAPDTGDATGHAPAQTTGHAGAEPPVADAHDETGHTAPAAADTHATAAPAGPAGPPLTPQQAMEKQSVEIEALRQSLLQERAARAETEKKFQLALEAASAPREPELRLPPPPIAPPPVLAAARKSGATEPAKPQTLEERAKRAELEKKNQLAVEAAQALDPELYPPAGLKPVKDTAPDASSQGTLEERAARAERDKKTQLAMEASPVAANAPDPAPAQARKAGATRTGTGRYLEDCTVVGKTLAETLRGCAAEFKQKK